MNAVAEAPPLDPARDLAEDEGPEQYPDTTGEPAGQQLSISFDVGGHAPTTTSLRLTGGKIEIGDEFQKGQRIVLRIEAVVGEVAFVDKADPKTGQVNGTERRHKASIKDVRVEG